MKALCLSLVFFALVLTGCDKVAKKPVTLKVQPLSPAIAQPCKKLSKLNGTDGTAVANWFVKNIPAHNRCARNNDAVIASYNHLYKTVNEFNELLSDPKKLKEYRKKLKEEAKNK